MSTALIERDQSISGLPALGYASEVSEAPAGDEDSRQQTVAELLEIPREMLRANEKELIRFLDAELSSAEGERWQMMENFARWKLVYAAPMSQSPKHYPIWNASNMTMPVVKETVNTLSSQIKQSSMTAKPRWICKDLAPEWEPFTDELELFLDIASTRDLDLDVVMQDVILEFTKMGTSIVEVANHVDVRNSYRYSNDGKKVYKKDVVKHDGPIVRKVPISRFWIRAGERNPDDARWCGVQLSKQWWELKEMAAQKKLGNLAKIKNWARSMQPKDIVERTQDEIEKWEPQDDDRMEIFKINLAWDVDKDNRYEELVIFYHRDSRTILSARFLPWWHGQRGYVKFGFFPREDRFWDEGLCEMLEDLQHGITDKQNKRSDNETINALKMIIKRKMVKGIQQGDPLYTGKVIEVNDIWNDLREFQLSEIYPSTIQEESILRTYADRLAGMNEGAAGAAMPVTRTTAAAQIALLQTQANRIGMTIDGTREGLDRIGQLSLHLYHQFGTNGKALAWMGQRGKIVDGILRLPRHVQELGLAIRVSVPTAASNRQVKMESSLQLLNLMIQVYEKLWPFAQALAPESMGVVAHGMVHSAKHYLENILESQETTNTDDILQGIIVLEKVLPAPEDMGGLTDYKRGAEATQVLDKLDRLAGLLQEAGDDSRRRDGARENGGDRRRLAPAEGNPSRGGPSIRYGGPPDNR